MITYNILKGTTDVSVVIRIIDSTDGTPETAVEHNTAGIDLEYRREGAASTDITEAALAALTTAHTDGGIEHIGNGYYRLDLPDAACAAGVDGVLVHGTVTGMVVIGCYVNLVDYDAFDGVRLGLTALPNAAADAAGGLPISDAGGLDLDDLPTTAEFEARTLAAADYFDPTADAVATVTTVTNQHTLAEIADAVWDETMTAHVTADSSAVHLKDILADTNELQVDDYPTSIAALQTDLDTLTAGVALTAASIDAIWDETLTSHVTADSAAVHLKDIITDTAEIGAAGAGLTALATQASVDTIDDFLDTEIAAIVAAVITNAAGADVAADIIALQTSVDALENISAAQVNAEVIDVLRTDTVAEPTGVPSTTATLADKIGHLHMALVNQVTVTATKKTIFDAGNAAEWEKDLSDDATTYTETAANAI